MLRRRSLSLHVPSSQGVSRRSTTVREILPQLLGWSSREVSSLSLRSRPLALSVVSPCAKQTRLGMCLRKVRNTVAHFLHSRDICCGHWDQTLLRRPAAATAYEDSRHADVDGQPRERRRAQPAYADSVPRIMELACPSACLSKHSLSGRQERITGKQTNWPNGDYFRFYPSQRTSIGPWDIFDEALSMGEAAE